MKKSQSASPVWLTAVAALAVVGFYLFGGAGLLESVEADDQSTPVVRSDDIGPAADTTDQFSNLDPITVTALPAEAIETLALIQNGGPFPFDRDDTVFQNREALLPDHERGYYREYTVITPGADDRGARRIVAGADGDRYYTSDHYQSFNEIVGAEQ